MGLKIGKFSLGDFKNSMKKFFDNNSNASKEDKQHFYNSQRYHANESNKYAWSNKYSDNKKEHYHFRVFEEQKQKGRLLTDEERKKIYNENNEFWDDVKKTTDRVMKSKGLYKI